MKDISNKLLVTFILLMPFTSAFALNGTINLAVLAGVLLFSITVFKIIQQKSLPVNFLSVEPFVVFIFLFFVLLSYLVNGRSTSGSLNHLLAYYSSFILFFISPLLFFYNTSQPQKLFHITLKFISVAVLISALFALIEFILNNLFSVAITDFIPRANVKEYDPLALGIFIRSRGFAEESGHFGFLMELFTPICIYFLYISKLCTYSNFWKNIFITCIILAILTSFSVSTFILLPTCFLIAIVLKFKLVYTAIKKNIFKILTTILVIVAMWQFVNLFLPLNEILQITIDQKFDSFSLNDRLDRADYFWKTFPKLPIENILFGSGPSWYKIFELDDSYSFLVLYQTITFEIGLIGLLCLLLLMALVLVKLLQIKDVISVFFLTAFLAGIFHYASIANYWYPWYWFLLSFILFYYNYNSLKVQSEN